MRLAPLLAIFARWARGRIARFSRLMPPRWLRSPRLTPSAGWKPTLPSSPNLLSPSRSLLRSPSMPEKQSTAPSTETNTGCLLVVDDKEANIQVVGAALGKLGYEIVPATGGIEAFKRLAVRRPDLILLDLLMRDMDGFEVCRRIRENPD